MPENKVTMIGPDGQAWDIPQDQVQAALKEGGKLAQDIIGPDGARYAIPFDKVHDALKAGGQLAPPGMPSPTQNLNMHGEKFNPAEAIAYAVSNPKRGWEAMTAGMQQTEKELQDPNKTGVEGAMNTVADTSLGAIKAGVRSGAGIYNLGAGIINKVGNTIPHVADEKDLPMADPGPEWESTSTAQTVGTVAENVAEFMLGDAALKGLAVGDRLLKIGKISKLVEGMPPVLQKALMIGMNSVRQGVVGGAQGLVQGEDLGEAAETGAITGAVGAAADVGGSLLGKAVSGVKGKIASRLAGEEMKPVEGAVEQNLRGVAAGVADDAGAPLKLRNTTAGDLLNGKPNTDPLTVGPQSVRDVFQEVSDNVRAGAKDLFGTIDSATGGRYQVLENALNSNGKALRAAASEEEASALLKTRGELQSKLEAVFADAQKSGQVSAEDVAKAKAAWKQASALEDVDNAVKMSTSGMRPELANAGNIHGDLLSQEAVDPKKLFVRLNKLYDSGRLQEAFGPNYKGHVTTLMKVLDLASQPEKAGMWKEILSSLIKHGTLSAAGGVFGYHEGGLAGAATGLVAGAAAPSMASATVKLMTSPRALRVAYTLLSTGQKIGPAGKGIPALTNALQMDEKAKKN